ncbi:MAG: Gfo/Idh/MocA family oxidoreductase [Micropruina sp.]|nr:Gfo/Idh/MocA family oxidoreductase [Micropruina sp.]
MGILGTGWIAGRFSSALARFTEQRVAAIGSRTGAAADRFAAQLGGSPTVHGSYEALVADPAVDVIYVATPHPAHLEHALLAIAAGKHVLVEKPLGLNATQAATVAEAARAAGVFCAEAMWTLHLPKFDVIRQLLADGALGELRTVAAEIGEWFDPGHRILDPALAGGCMLDLGTYPVMFSTWVAGEPDQVEAVGQRDAGGVMASTAMALRSADGVTSTLLATLAAAVPTTASIGGSAGLLTLDGPFYQPGGFTLSLRGGAELSFLEEPIGHQGLHYQASHAAHCIGHGQTESRHRPLADTIATLATMDRIRRCTSDSFAGE